MTKLKIRTYPDPVLKMVATPYKEITDEDRQLAKDMIEAMYQAKGVGLAAPQVGISKRLIVCSPESKKGKEFIFFNPIIAKKCGEVMGEEGCLSFPGVTGEVLRAEEIDFEALDIEGKSVKQTIHGFFARVIQHEVDHLDGIVFPDRVHFEKRKLIFEEYEGNKII